ncbi:MAG: glycosyltransferase family 4 protein, partial [Miltoncostaeaceae bacterium]
MSSLAGVLWRGPLTDPSGYAAEGRAFVRGLVEEGVRLRVDPAVWHYREAITGGERERLADLMETELPSVDASVQHTFGRLFDPYAPGRLRIGRTMFETDRIPRDWVARCNQMDEVWVPSEAGRQAFASAGVDPDRLAVIPSPLELDRLDPDVEPLSLPDAHGTVFLAAFDWTLRKGWDVLLAAWCEAFRADDDVTLVLKTWSTSRGLDTDAIADELVGHVRSLGHDAGSIPDIVLFDRLLPERRMSALYRAADAYLAPSRGEGWGRPAVEAMAVGCPVVATDWSGPSAYVDSEVGWPVGHRLVDVPEAAVAEVPGFAGHRWAEPDRGDLIDALRAVHADPGEARRRGVRARERAAGFDHRRVARAMLARLDAASPRPRPRPRGADVPPVVLEGPILASHSLAGVNRELARGLMGLGGLDLALVDTQGIDLDADDEPSLAPLVAATERLLPAPPAVTVRHRYPPSFAPPSSGRLALVMPWEFGPVPSGWVAQIEETADEVWVPSRWSRDGYVASGVA